MTTVQQGTFQPGLDV